MDIRSLPSMDVYVTTPPCQDYSRAGKGLADESPRGMLVYHSLRVIEAHRPKVVVFENVARLCKRGSVYKKVCNSLEKAGYVLMDKDNPLVDCWRHGIPQSRQRIILVGFYGGVCKSPD